MAFEKLLDWWSRHSYDKHVYSGIGMYRAGSNASWKDPNQLPNQIKLMRQYSNVQGSIYFSSKSFNNNPNGWSDSLRNNYYRMPVKTPQMSWLPKKPDQSNSTSSLPASLRNRENQDAHVKGQKWSFLSEFLFCRRKLDYRNKSFCQYLKVWKKCLLYQSD